MGAVDEAIEAIVAEEGVAFDEGEESVAGGDEAVDDFADVVAVLDVAGGVGGAGDGGDGEDGYFGMFGADGVEKGLVDFADGFDVGVVLGEIEDEEGGVDFGGHVGDDGFAFAVAGEAEVDEVGVELAGEDGLVAHAGAAGATALGDGGAIEDDGFSVGEAARAGDGGVVVEADFDNFGGFVEGEVEGDFAGLFGEAGEEDVFDDFAFGGVFGGGGGGAVLAVDVEVDAGLAESVHVGHVGRGGVFDADGDGGGGGAEADAAAGGGLAEVPDGCGELGLETAGEADEFAVVFGEPGEAVDREFGVGGGEPGEGGQEEEGGHDLYTILLTAICRSRKLRSC